MLIYASAFFLTLPKSTVMFDMRRSQGEIATYSTCANNVTKNSLQQRIDGTTKGAARHLRLSKFTRSMRSKQSLIMKYQITFERNE